MDLSKVLAQLRLELEHIDAAILSLEKLQTSGTRRGRPSRQLAELQKLKETIQAVVPPRRPERRR